MSKKVVLSADEATATVSEAELTDIFTTVFSKNEAVLGTYGLVQRIGLFVGGMSVQNKRKNGSWNPI
jgi:hypothetical protein